MLLHRIAHSKHINDMTGTGGLYASGRWHSRGIRIIYFSEHVSLAKLEVLANASFIPKNMCLLTVSMPDSVSFKQLDISDLPAEWDCYPYIEELRKLCHDWLHLAETLVLKVPSSQSENEFNYLINPLHKDVKKLKIVKTETIHFDHRLKL